MSPSAAGGRVAVAASGSSSPARPASSATSSSPSACSCNRSARSRPASADASARRCGPRGVVRVLGPADRLEHAGPRRAPDSPASSARSCAARRRAPRWSSGRTQSACPATTSASVKMPVAHRHEPLAEGAAVEGVASAGDDRLQRQRHAGSPNRCAPGWSPGRPARRARPHPAHRASATRRPAAGWPGTRPAARVIAGRSTVARSRRPKRSCSAIHPSTHPGTVTVRGSWRNGIERWRSARSDAADTPEPARPVALSTDDVAVGRAHQGEEVATHPAQVRRRHGDGGVGGDGRVDGVATSIEDGHGGLRSPVDRRWPPRPAGPELTRWAR